MKLKDSAAFNLLLGLALLFFLGLAPLFFRRARARKQLVIVGHAHGDLDAVGAAYGLAMLLEELLKQERDPLDLGLPKGTKLVVARHGKLRAEIKFLLSNKFRFRKIRKVESVKGMTLALVDHHNPRQSPPGDARIVAVVDHHYPQLELLPGGVRYRKVEVMGSCCTMIARLYVECGVAISRDVAVLLLAGLLSDTKVAGVNMTAEDRVVLNQLVAITGIDDYRAFGRKLFEVAEKELSKKQVEDLVEVDQKPIEVREARFYTTSFQVFDLQCITTRTQELRAEMKRRIAVCNYMACIFMLLDLETYKCSVLIYGDEERVAKALGCGEPDDYGWSEVDFASRKDLERRLKEAYK